jgi:hypothetical protein
VFKQTAILLRNPVGFSGRVLGKGVAHVDYFTNRVNYFVQCRGCLREIAILTKRGCDAEKHPTVFSSTFHSFAECSE